ncbi:MAG: glutamine--fructose-6-phosphate transaminase (isomerizing) [Alphaproteobacteria bacterium]|nr:glutamine--fructose-6-phosphate transaminase (isomerizing) [Alphaproteobacteria bacterium]
MCGIVGIVSEKRDVAESLLEGLKRLEYRGYDSAGIATLIDGKLAMRRATGKLKALSDKLESDPLRGHVGIGHTRWATHGRPSEDNAHPHSSEKVALVHNGIIENYRDLRHALEAKGHVFRSETDTESIAHLITDFLNMGMTPQEATAAALPCLDGAFALAVLFQDHNNLLIGARRGSPLAIGYGEGEMYLGSDALALAPMTNRITYLEEGDWVEITAESAIIHDKHGDIAIRAIHETGLSALEIGKGTYRHYMLKEIFEQPVVIGDALETMTFGDYQIALPDLPFDWKNIRRLSIVACGTAYYAGMTARYWFEQLAGLPTDFDVASEYRYRGALVDPSDVMIVISQSGETADSLAALRYAKERGQKIVSVVNVQHSTIARESDAIVPSLCGPEISVASTKAFTSQLIVLLCMALQAGEKRGFLSTDKATEIVDALRGLPSKMNDVLRDDNRLQEVAQNIATTKAIFYLGRGLMYPLALEGALKLKEISYIHAEGYPAGELKHGPLALVDEHMPVVVLAPYDSLFEKTSSNVQEIVARGGRIHLFTDKVGHANIGAGITWSLVLPAIHEAIAPILYAAPLQLLAYYTALAKGTDVDHPRNLAKSVTVE